MRRPAAGLALVLALAAGAAPAGGATTNAAAGAGAGPRTTPRPASTARPAATTVTTANPLVRPSVLDRPPVGHRLTPDQVTAIARRVPKVAAAVRDSRGSYPVAYEKGALQWQVSWFSRAGREIAQVLIDEPAGRVREAWTGFQVPWTMARGYPGAFGRKVSALYIWVPLSLLFLAPFFDWRRPLRLVHLDLLALWSFSISLAFFDHAEIYTSVPLSYPPLAYVLGRMLWIGLRRSPTPAVRVAVPAPWLMIGLVFLIGFRIALNVTDSNVIDVGYAGVIGAQRIADGQAIYGTFPTENQRGDTYGPVSYEAYVRCLPPTGCARSPTGGGGCVRSSSSAWASRSPRGWRSSPRSRTTGCARSTTGRSATRSAGGRRSRSGGSTAGSAGRSQRSRSPRSCSPSASRSSRGGRTWSAWRRSPRPS
ncbi:MAG: hypothetical protein LC720_00790 [Actinobacteria bacterium]|nr:hypothetical protein [Actinomycetota bacterium]